MATDTIRAKMNTEMARSQPGDSIPMRSRVDRYRIVAPAPTAAAMIKSRIFKCFFEDDIPLIPLFGERLICLRQMNVLLRSPVYTESEVKSSVSIQFFNCSGQCLE